MLNGICLDFMTLTWLLLFFLVVLLVFVFILDSVQILVKLLTASSGCSILGAHLGSVIMLGNRGAVALSLLIAGYLVDAGVKNSFFLVSYGVASLIVALAHIVLLRRGMIFGIVKYAFRRLYDKNIPNGVWNRLTFKGVCRYAPWLTLFVVTAVSFAGLLIPSVLASTFSSHRAALMQTGFLINTTATIVYVLHVEKKLAIVISGEDFASLERMYCIYINSRFFSYVTISALFFMVHFFL